MDTYRIVTGPFHSPARFARAPRHTDIVDAVREMGTGMVLADDGRLVAFHESHLETLQGLARTPR